MKRHMMTWLAVAVALVGAILIAVFAPRSNKELQGVVTVSAAEQALIPQESLGVQDESHEIYRLYYKNELIGIVQNYDKIDEVIAKAYEQRYKAEYANSKISLANDVYIVEETTNIIYQNRDDAITQYLYDNDLFAVKAIKVEISNGNIVYVKSEAEFTNALRRYALVFVSESTYAQLAANQDIAKLTSYGEQDVNVYLKEKITCSESLASSSDILVDEDAIFTYLCYGLDYTLDYYTIELYDTIEGVAMKNDMTTEQLMAINPRLVSEDQTLQVGEQLNITYFKSPITLVVEKQRFTKETVYQPAAKYETDESLQAGKMEKVTAGSDGYKDSLYTDVYVNGILTSYKLESSTIIVPAVQAVYRVGTGVTDYDIGDLNFRLPVDNPKIVCKWGCYSGHKGTDFINRYNRYDVIYACEDGVIIKNTYNSAGGWLYKINHGNGFVFLYEHMRKKGFLPVGTHVTRGQIIGYIGRTGIAYSVHVHIGIIINGVYVDPCTILPC